MGPQGMGFPRSGRWAARPSQAGKKFILFLLVDITGARADGEPRESLVSPATMGRNSPRFGLLHCSARISAFHRLG